MKSICEIFLIEAQMLANLYDLLFYINPDIQSHFQAWNYNSVIYSNSIPLLKATQRNVLRAFFHVCVIESCHRSALSLSLSSLPAVSITTLIWTGIMQNNRQFQFFVYVSSYSINSQHNIINGMRDTILPSAVSVNISWHQIRGKEL
jgi:hypothetical protein